MKKTQIILDATIAAFYEGRRLSGMQGIAT